MTHLKRINVPSTWPVERKSTKFITKPSPGPHRLEESMPLGVILREILKLGKEKREIKIILNDNKVLVNNKIRKKFDFPVGILDTLSIPDISKFYKLVYSTKGRLILKEINKVFNTIPFSLVFLLIFFVDKPVSIYGLNTK